MDVGKCFAQLWPKRPSNHMLQVCLRCTLDVKTPRTHFLLNGIRSCANGVCDAGLRRAGNLLRMPKVPWHSLLHCLLQRQYSKYNQRSIFFVCSTDNVDRTCTGSLLQCSLSICNVHMPRITFMRMLALLQSWMWSSPLLESDVMNFDMQQKLNGCSKHFAQPRHTV